MTAGPHQLRIDLSTAGSAAALQVTYQGPDTHNGPLAVPMSVLAPGFGLKTSAAVPTSVNPQGSAFTNKMAYTQPALALPTSLWNQGGGHADHDPTLRRGCRRQPGRPAEIVHRPVPGRRDDPRRDPHELV